ncbi:uncharacterized protein EI90DRAFT_3027973 [Cantharellus anzutake]|uniref:uncharacterized protein n=1 Tax=Cantharellus anzutake TaxID=1750568 RepID=UPI00190403FA|nr:uncharacterized protein EI90DRAFT_3027973 [Cantharellus anzutake]KAF8344026.1 hypothetical protein EI90DRAFT_3027973 [Cantharellus anzutake]
MDPMSKLVVFTGGTAGLGLAALGKLIENAPTNFEATPRFNYEVYIGARSTSDGALQAHFEGVRQSSPSPLEVKAHLLPLDLASLDSIERFAQDVLSNIVKPNKKIDILVLNAGIVVRNVRKTVKLPDNREFESTLFVNTLSQAVLLKRLLHVMADDGRIVLVGSEKHKVPAKTVVAPSTIEDLLSGGKWEGRNAYGLSKLVQMHLFFILKDEINRRWPSEGNKPSVVAISPGFVPETKLAREWPWILQLIGRYVLTLFPFTTPLPVAANTILRGMVDTTLSSGTYLGRTGAIAPLEECNDPTKRDEWRSWFVELGFWKTGADVN